MKTLTASLSISFALVLIFTASKVFAERDQIVGFPLTPLIERKLSEMVSQSSLRTHCDVIVGFNNGIQRPADRLEKLVRQETPYTVRLLTDALSNLTDTTGLTRPSAEPRTLPELQLSQIGMVIGDPHHGNFGLRLGLFKQSQVDHNEYTVIDIDEVNLGSMALDFARYLIFLKAKHGNLSAFFGSDFEEALHQSYYQGLRLESPFEIPQFIQEELNASQQSLRDKVLRFASNRTNSEGKFISKIYEKENLLPFSTKNMKPQFLQAMNFDPENGDKKEFKRELTEKIVLSLQRALGPANVQVLDIAILERNNGGSSEMQRFLVSIETIYQNESLRLVVEFKQNSERAAWSPAVDNPQALTALERYEFALQVTAPNAGPLLHVVNFGRTHFLVKVKGGMDIEAKTKDEHRQLALFNSYVMGRFHGGQGPAISGPYRQQVLASPAIFKQNLRRISDQVLLTLARESGLSR